MSARPSGVLDMFLCDPGAPYLLSGGDMNCDEAEAEPPGVVGVYGV